MISPSIPCAQSLSRVWLSASTWTGAHQAPLSVGILQARKPVWVAMPSSRGSSQPGVETRSSALQADSLPSEPPSIKLHYCVRMRQQLGNCCYRGKRWFTRDKKGRESWSSWDLTSGRRCSLGEDQSSDLGEASRASQDRTRGEEFTEQLGPQGLASAHQP